MGCRLEVSQICVLRPVISAPVTDWERLASRVSKLRENERRVVWKSVGWGLVACISTSMRGVLAQAKS